MPEPETIESLHKRLILESPELDEKIRQIVRQEYQSMNLDQRLTCEDVARMYKKTKATVYRWSAEELAKINLRKIRLGGEYVFERIGLKNV